MTKKRTIEVDEQTYDAIQALKANSMEGTADPLSDELAIFLGVRLAYLMSTTSEEQWMFAFGRAVEETYDRKRNATTPAP